MKLLNILETSILGILLYLATALIAVIIIVTIAYICGEYNTVEYIVTNFEDGAYLLYLYGAIHCTIFYLVIWQYKKAKKNGTKK